MALSLIISGGRALKDSQLHYPNYWGGPVFAPLAIALGLLLLVIVIVKWRSLHETGQRLRGKALRRQQRPPAKQSPIEDFDRPWNP
jgi:hypothetical protein